MEIKRYITIGLFIFGIFNAIIVFTFIYLGLFKIYTVSEGQGALLFLIFFFAVLGIGSGAYAADEGWLKK